MINWISILDKQPQQGERFIELIIVEDYDPLIGFRTWDCEGPYEEYVKFYEADGHIYPGFWWAKIEDFDLPKTAPHNTLDGNIS